MTSGNVLCNMIGLPDCFEHSPVPISMKRCPINGHGRNHQERTQ